MVHSERLAIVHAGIRAGMSVRDARSYADSLAPDTRLTAAQAAARELGLTAEDVEFALAGSISGEDDAKRGSRNVGER